MRVVMIMRANTVLIGAIIATIATGRAMAAPSTASAPVAKWTLTQWTEAPAQIAPINAPFPMPQLKRPAFPNRSFSIADFGAVGDGKTKNTEAFRKAIAACHQAGGGHVVVPAGKWFTGAIHLTNNINLRFEQGAEIHFSDDPADYLPVVFTRWAGFELMNYSPLIYAYGCRNIAITGPGKLYGHGQKWWEWLKQETQTARRVYEEQVLKNVPPERRIYGTPETPLRPQFVNPIHCTNVLFEGFTIAAGGPFWTFDITYCEDIIVRGLTINTMGGPNNDGVNFNSSRNGLLEYCEINSGDDCCALKSGINQDGWRVGRPAENIVIRHVRGLKGSTGGVVCGSDMSGGVRNIHVYDCEFTGNQRPLWIKSNSARGGTVENISYENIRLRNVRVALFAQTDYVSYMAARDDEAFPTFRNIAYRNITVEGAQIPANINNSYKPIEGVTLENITITGAKSNMRFNHIQGLTLKDVTCNGSSDRTITITNCTDVVRTGDELPPALQSYDPSGQIRFRTPAEADAKRQELIQYIWATGLPIYALPTVTTNIGPAVFSKDLSGLNGALATSVDRLDANVSPYEFHGICYLIHPRAVTVNNRRLVVLNSGHRRTQAFALGVNDTANRLLSDGFSVLMTDMPLVGFNTHKEIMLPNGQGTVTITNSNSAGHNEMFAKLTPPTLPGGAVFRLFLEPIIQGVNYFLRTTPDTLDVSFVGLSGGGWTGHMLAALDTRIKQSFPVAGSYPLYIREVVSMSDDAEQRYAPLYLETDSNGDGVLDTASGVATWLEIYALGGYGPGRRQIQVLNFYDECCFFGPAFMTYTNFVSTVVRNLGRGEWSLYADTCHKKHLISSNVLNLVIMPVLTGKAPGEPAAREKRPEPP